MSVAVTVPKTLEEIIQKFDAQREPYDEHAIGGQLKIAREALKSPSDAKNAGAWAEVLAFALATGSHENPWNSYFGPMGSGITKEGKQIFFPDIAGTPPTVVDHWATRARSLNHPFLKSRYADLSWEFSRLIGERKRDPEDAYLAIDNYLAAIPLMKEDHEQVAFAKRALDLSIILKDSKRRDISRDALMNIHRKFMRNRAGMWWHTVDRLLDDKRAGVTDAERDELIADLESIVTRASDSGDPQKFNPHEAKDAIERLLPHYRRLGKVDDCKRLQKTVGQAFEQFASNADPMLASALLQSATDAFGAAGMDSDRDRVRILMQKKIRESGQNLQKIEHKIEIKKDDMDKVIDALIVDDVAKSFVRLAREFMLRRADLENQVEKTLETAPIMAHITAMIYADDRVAAKISGVEEDAQGRLFHEATFAFSFARIWLHNAFHRLFERFEVLPEHFVGWANRHNLYDDMSLLMEGIGAWMRHDHVKAAHVLVPQIEKALRKIADDLGVPVTKEIPQVKGTSVAIGMGEILYNEKVADALGPDLTLHFQALYSDPRGMNLRNEIAHGLMPSGAFYWHPTNLIVHSLLMLGVWKELSATNKPGKGD